jgi:hypothetical protein
MVRNFDAFTTDVGAMLKWHPGNDDFHGATGCVGEETPPNHKDLRRYKKAEIYLDVKNNYSTEVQHNRQYSMVGRRL